MIDRVMVIEFRMDNECGNGAGCFEVEVWADTAKFTNVQHDLKSVEIWPEKVRYSSKIKPKLRA